MYSISERRKEIQKEFKKREKKTKKKNKKLFKKYKHGMPIIKVSNKQNKKAVRKTFNKEFRILFDDMTDYERDDLLLGLEMRKLFPSPEKLQEKWKLKRREQKVRKKEFNKYMKKQKIKNLNDIIFAERDFDKYLEFKAYKKKTKGLISTDPLMKSIIRIDERRLEKTLDKLYSESVANAAATIAKFDKLMWGDNTKIDLSLLRDKDDIIESSTKKLLKTLNKTSLESFRI